MDIEVDIPGVGRVAFPDTMSDDDIAQAAERLHSDAVLAKGDTYTGPSTFREGFTQSLKQTAADAGKGVLRGIAATFDPRTYINAASDKKAQEAAMVDRIDQPGAGDYGTGEAKAFLRTLSDPSSGGEMIGGLATGLAVPAVAGKAKAGLRSGSDWLMQKALKPKDALVNARKGAGYGSKQAISRAVLDEGRIVSRGSLGKAQEALDATDAAAQARLDAGAGRGVTVQPGDVTGSINQLADSGLFAEQVNAAPDVAAIRGVADSFESNPRLPSKPIMQQVEQTVTSPIVDEFSRPIQTVTKTTKQTGRELQPIPADQAHRIAMNTGRNLKGKFGRLGGATVEAEKAGREAITSQLRGQIPELNPLWDAEARQITVRDALEQALERVNNRDVVGLTGIVGAVKNPALMAGALADRSAWFKSLLAQGLNRASKPGTVTPALLRAAILARLDQGGGDW